MIRVEKFIDYSKIKQPVINVTRNKIYGHNVSKIKLNQSVNGGTFRINRGALVYERGKNEAKIGLDKKHKKSLLGNKNRITKKKRKHQHAGLYYKYKKKSQQFKLREDEPTNQHNIVIQQKLNHKPSHGQNHTAMSAEKEKKKEQRLKVSLVKDR